ncbi:hypothetical protein OIU34_18560 [Pararhizobium sp. BT-229]|uniref:FAD-dependent thymidylate synthase n=1 Tax=Pararhizobium sp. BT-229 TaxID=2986923 RepID=UPI0021F7E9D5|nr:hypothetical protein [Pararhizobium sp. BT-229]MCV9963882.1 hypothetical protein [Pararhizobium sp. BT-229]
MPESDFIGLGYVFDALMNVPNEELLEEFLDATGVAWHEPSDAADPRIVRDFSVKVAALGGIPFVRVADGHLALANAPHQPFSLQGYRSAIRSMMAYSGMMSYLNSGRLSVDEICDAMDSKGHGSVAHTVQVSLLVSGVTTAVENEFNSQRDLVHLSRITVARTSIQSSPPIVVRDPTMLDAYRRVAKVAAAGRAMMSGKGRDFQETANQLFPVAKATAFIMTGTLRNLFKLTSSMSDDGKEREFRDVLARVDQLLKDLIGPETGKE